MDRNREQELLEFTHLPQSWVGNWYRQNELSIYFLPLTTRSFSIIVNDDGIQGSRWQVGLRFGACEMCNPLPKTPLSRMLIVLAPPQGVALAKDWAQNAPIEALDVWLIASGKFQEPMQHRVYTWLQCDYWTFYGTSRLSCLCVQDKKHKQEEITTTYYDSVSYIGN